MKYNHALHEPEQLPKISMLQVFIFPQQHAQQERLTVTQAVCDETATDEEHEVAGGGSWWVVAFAVVRKRGAGGQVVLEFESQSSNAHCSNAMQGTSRPSRLACLSQCLKSQYSRRMNFSPHRLLLDGMRDGLLIHGQMWMNYEF